MLLIRIGRFGKPLLWDRLELQFVFSLSLSLFFHKAKKEASYKLRCVSKCVSEETVRKPV